VKWQPKAKRPRYSSATICWRDPIKRDVVEVLSSSHNDEETTSPEPDLGFSVFVFELGQGCGVDWGGICAGIFSWTGAGPRLALRRRRSEVLPQEGKEYIGIFTQAVVVVTCN
jgi:hypothetical protein